MAESKKKTRVNANINSNTNFSNQEGEPAMAKKNAITNIDNAEPTTTINQKGNSKMKLSEIQPILLSLDEFNSKTAQEIASLMGERISRERGKAELVNRVKEGRVRINAAETLMDWTFRNVQIDGIKAKVRGTKNAKVTLTHDQFEALTDSEKADYINEYTHKRRIADAIIPELIRKGMPISAEDVVRLTCGRILIEGVVVERKGNGRQPAITNGVEFA